MEIIFPHTKSFLISICYRPPSSSKYLPTNFNILFNDLLSTASAEEKEILLTGDFDCNQYGKKDDCKELKSLFTLYNLKQLINMPTRITNICKSTIDLVLTNEPFNITTTKTFPMGFSDHELIGFSRKVNHIRTNPKTVRSCNYKNYNSDNIIKDLDNSDWSRIYLASSINKSVSQLLLTC